MTKSAIIHIGSDKAGSSSIQYFLGRNQEALRARRIHLVRTGLARAAGQPFLFLDLDDPRWGELPSEIEEHDAATDTFLFSWEGIHHYKYDDLFKLRKHLDGLELKFVFYIREQSELIQSGLLQRMKQDNLHDFDFVKIDPKSPHLHPPTRNYLETIERFERVFGEGSIDVRVFERKQLQDGDAKHDFLHAIGIEPSEDFIDYGDVNESLWVEAAVAIQLLDPLARSKEDRRAIRDAGMAVSSIRSGAKYFLSEAVVDEIRGHYAETNRAVAQRFFNRDALFTLKPAFSADGVNETATSEFMRDMLAIWPHYPMAWGKVPAGRMLSRNGRTLEGWASVEAGMRLTGETGRIRIHFPPRGLFPEHIAGTLQLLTVGRVHRHVRLSVEGGETKVIRAPHEKYRISLDALKPYGAVDLTVEIADDQGPLDVDELYVGFTAT